MLLQKKAGQIFFSFKKMEVWAVVYLFCFTWGDHLVYTCNFVWVCILIFLCYLLWFWHTFIYAILLHCLSFFVCVGCVCVWFSVDYFWCKMKIKALDLVSSGKDEKIGGCTVRFGYPWQTIQGIQPVFNFKIIHPYPHCRTPTLHSLKICDRDDWPPRSHPLTPFFGLLSPNDPLFEFTTNFRQSQTRHQKQDFW